MSRVWFRIPVRNRVNMAVFIMGTAFWFVIPVLSESLFIKQMMDLEVWAQSKNPGLIETPLESEELAIDKANDRIKDSALSTVDSLDSFFYDERIENEEKKSNIRIRLSSFTEEKEGTEFSADVRLRLVLPGFNKKFRLFVSGDPDDGIDIDNTSEDDARESFESTDEENVTISLWYAFKDTARRNISLQNGLRFRSGSAVFFTGPRFRRTIPLATWTLRGTQTLRWFTDEGWESKTRLNIERQLNERFFLRATTRGSWYENTNGFFYRFQIYLFQTLSRRRALRYEWINYFETRPNNRLHKVKLRVRYRQSIWRNRLFVEVVPQCSFPKDRNFEFVPGIMFRLEMFFGLKKLW